MGSGAATLPPRGAAGSEAVATSLIESFFDPVAVLSARWTWIDFNDGYAGLHEQWYGAPPRTGEDRRPLSGALGPEDPELRHWARALAGDAFVADIERRSGGDATHYELSFRPMRDRDGLVLGATLVVRDTTGERRAEAALRDRERRLTRALDAAGIAEWALDLASRRFAPSPRFSALMGYPEDRTLTLDEVEARYHPDDRAAVAARMAVVLASPAPLVEYRYRIVLPGGAVRWHWCRGEVIFDARGGPVRATGIVMDVTERRLAELASETFAAERDLERAQLEAVVRQMPVGVIVAAAPSGRSLLVNDQVSTIWRSRLHRLDGIVDLAALRGRRGELPLEPEAWPIARSILAGEIVREEEIEILRGDGSAGRIAVSSAPIRDAEGRITAAVAAVHDLTERHAAEAQRRLLAAEIDHRANNMLAVLQAIVMLTRRGAHTVESYAEMLRGRLESLARSHALLARHGWTDVSLFELARGEIAACTPAADRVQLSGDDARLGRREAQALGLVVHELLVNASSHGALGAPDGEVIVTVRREADRSEARLHLRWCEAGGPPVDPVPQRGFGGAIIEHSLRDLGGRAALDTTSGSYCWDLFLPLVLPPDGDHERWPAASDARG